MRIFSLKIITFTFNYKVNNIDPQWKKLFDTIGVTQTELEDEETSKFIYDFVESHGGIEKASEELAKSKDGGIIRLEKQIFTLQKKKKEGNK